MRRLLLISLLACGSILSAQTAPAAQETPKREEPPAATLKATTRLVLVDAVITDKHGHPVTDLKKEEVEVFENGKPQRISVMSLQHFTGSKDRALPPLPKLPPNIYSNMPAVVPPDQPPTILLLDWLDTRNIEDQWYARQQAAKYLRSQAAGQRLAVYVLTREGLQLLQDFTSDPAALQAALAKAQPSRDSRQPEVAAPTTGEPSLSPFPAGLSQSANSMSVAEAALAQLQQSFIAISDTVVCGEVHVALQDLAKHVSGYHGRKNLVWLAGGFPGLQFVDPERMLADNPCRPQMVRTAKAVNEAQIAIYTVDARGLVAGPIEATRPGGPRNGPAFGGTVAGFNARHAGTLIAMNQISDQTGGRSLHNWNDIAGSINKAVEEGSNYYIFGYYPEDKDWNGNWRSLAVKLKRSGLEVRARRGYFATDKAEIDPTSKEAKDTFGEALAWGQADWTQIPMDIQVVPGEETIVRYAVDGSVLSWEPMPDGSRRDKLSFVLFAFDRKGRLMKTVEENADASLDAQHARTANSAVPYQQKVKLLPGDYVIKAAVRDNRSGLIGTVHADLHVPGERGLKTREPNSGAEKQ